MKLQDIPEDIEPRVGDILEIEQGDVCFEVRIIGITADGYLCEQDNVQGAVLLEGVDLDHSDVSDITGYIAEEKVRLDSKCWKGKKIGNPKTKMKGGVRVNNCVPEGQEDIEESGLQYYTGVKKHGEKYMKLAAKAGREGASQEELGRLKDRYSKAEKTDEGRFDEPLTGWHIVYRNSGNPVHATPSFETKEQAQKYLMTKMFANHQDFKVVHTAGVGLAEGSDLPPKVIEMIKKIAQSSASPEHKKAAIDALVAKYSKKGVAEGSGPKEKQKTPYRDINSPEYRKAADKQKQQMAKDAAAEPGKKLADKIAKKGVAEGYTGRETKDGTWRVFKDGKAVAVAGPFKSREEAAAWIKKQKQGVNESTEQSLQKKIQSRRDALGLAREQRRARGQHQQGQREIKLQAEIDNLNDQLRELKKQDVKEGSDDIRKKISKFEELALQANKAGDDAKSKMYQQKIQSLKQKKSQRAQEGLAHPDTLKEYSFAEKQTYMNFLAAKAKKYGVQSLKPEERSELMAYLQAQKMTKEQQGVAEGPEEHEYSLSMGNRQRPGSDRLDTDSQSRMDAVQAREHDLKQRTIDILLKRHPTWERSDLELAPLPELIDMLRKPANEDMDEAKYQGREVPLGKKMAGDVKKSKVYVRKPNGKVVKVNFGDKDMKIKKSNPARRKSFRARHNCDNPGPRWKARYWSCRSW